MANFLDLVPGQVVLIVKEYGYPKVSKDPKTAAVIAFAYPTLAVTTTGRLLTSADAVGIFPRSTVLTPKHYRVSAKARRLKNALDLPLELAYEGEPIQEER